jgi:two-component sensor histidine kinase
MNTPSHVFPDPPGVLAVLTDARQPDHPVVWASDPFCRFTGHPRSEVVGRGHWSFVTGGPEAPGARRLQEAVRAGRSAHALLVGRKKDGTEFYDSITVHAIRENPADEASPVQYALGIHLDAMARDNADPDVPARSTEDGPWAAREQFAMDLHDGLGHELAGLSLLASVLADQLAGEGSAHAPAAARVAALVQQAFASARGMAAGLDPVEPGGLRKALRGLCASSDGGSPGVSVRARIGPAGDLETHEAGHLYRIAQEAVSNALKHASATRIAVSLRRTACGTVLVVRDDGCGLAKAPARPLDDGLRTGRGLDGMRRRADRIAAELTVSSPASGGTRVRCVVPSRIPA